MDTDGNGYLDFKEFILAIDLVAARTPEEKLLWAFRMYDIDNSGEIDKSEMINVIKSVYKMLGIYFPRKWQYSSSTSTYSLRRFSFKELYMLHALANSNFTF